MTQNEIEIQERQVLLSPKIRKDMDNIEIPSKLHHHIQSSLFFPIPGWLCCQKNAYMVRIYKHYWLWQLPVIILNITLILIWNYTHNSKHPIIQLTELGYLAVGPVLCCALIRDKIFLWIIYWIIKQTVKLTCFTKEGRYHLFRSADCIGGLHSSFGVTGLIWNIIYAFGTYHRERYINWRVSTAFCLPIIFISICFIGLPCFRHWFHNSFERIHRYLSWFSLIVLIIHVILVNIHQYNMNLLTWNDFYKNTPIIFTIFLIVITIYPWLIIHYIKGNNIKVYPANKSVAIILPIKSPIGSVCKLSLDWIEFHVMGICPFGNTKDEAKSLILMKNLGDWTGYILHKSLNGDIYNHNFWCHRIKSPNFTQGLYNWNRVFFMVTGSGIYNIIDIYCHIFTFNIIII